MDKTMTKAELLELIESEREAWDAVLAEVGEARMTQPGAMGEWSVKDAIAHVTWSEREMIGVLETRALVGSELWNVSPDARNAAVYAENRDRSLADVLAESRAVYARLWEALQTLTEEEVNDPSRFRDMPADVLPWRIFAGSTYLHYRDHGQDIQAWLKRQG